MAIVAREAIYDALLAKLTLAGGTNFKTYTRRWKSAWDDPGAMLALLPMLVQWEDREEISYSDNRGIGRIMTISMRLELYAKIPVGHTVGVPDKSTSGSSVLNPLLDVLDNALAPVGMDGLQTLGGVVYDCRIEGEIVKVLGDEDPSGLCAALVPLKILVPF